MKTIKKATIVVILIIAVISIGFKYYTRSIEYNKSITGIRYEANNPSFEEKVQIEIEGLYKRKLLGDFIFEGYLYIDDIKYNFSISDDEFISPSFSQGGLYKKTERGYINAWVFINDNFDEFAIVFSEWSPTDGTVIAAPAKNRVEALNISNKLMEDFLSRLKSKELR